MKYLFEKVCEYCKLLCNSCSLFYLKRYKKEKTKKFRTVNTGFHYVKDSEKIINPCRVTLQLNEYKLFNTATHKIQNNKYCKCIPVAACRVRYKKLGKKPQLINELKSDNELFLRAGHGNCGKDALFIVQSEKYLVFGVANVLGGSSKSGINYDVFSGLLVKHACKNSIEFIKDIEKKSASNVKGQSCNNESIINPLHLLQTSFNDLLQYNCREVLSSSTACFGVYDCETKKLNVVNFGYSGVYVHTKSGLSYFPPVIKWNKYKSFPLKNPILENREKIVCLTHVIEVEWYCFKLTPGDYFIVGSEGVWDNVEICDWQRNSLYNQNIKHLFLNVLKENKNISENLAEWYKEKQKLAIELAEGFYYSVDFYSQTVARRQTPCKKPISNHYGRHYGGKRGEFSLIAVLV